MAARKKTAKKAATRKPAARKPAARKKKTTVKKVVARAKKIVGGREEGRLHPPDRGLSLLQTWRGNGGRR